MTTAPSLFSSPAPLRPSTAAAAAPARSLVDLLYDGFYLLTLLRKHSMPADADAFSGAIQGFLDDFERAALKAGFASQDIFDAKYAFCAAVDEAVLGARTPVRSLVDLLYDGFYLLTLLRKHSMPADADAFSGAIQGFLDDFERAALKAGFASQDIFDAKYAFCAAVDEAVLGARTPVRDAWERRPLQLALFGEQLAGENFFEKLEAARNGGASRIQALEVFHLCLLTGFKGRYLLEGPEKLKYLVSQLGEQITHIKGKAPGFSPHWAPPDQIVNAIRREIPLWIIAAVLALVGLVSYLGLEWQARSQVRETLAGFTDIVQLAPRPPTLTLTLP